MWIILRQNIYVIFLPIYYTLPKSFDRYNSEHRTYINPFISTTTEFEKKQNKNELIRRGLAFFRVAYNAGV